MASLLKKIPAGPGALLCARVAAPLLALLLAGCAGQMAYRDGRELVAQDQVEAGLLKLQEAVAAEPGNAQYKAAWLQTRERAVLRYLEQAERYEADNMPDLALQQYRRVLGIDPKNVKARAGVAKLEAVPRQAKMRAEAAAAIEGKQYDVARQRLSAILTERPGDEAAAAMLRDLTEKTAPPPVESGLARAFRQPISIEFRDAPLRQIFEIIARRSGLNFVFDKDVKADTKASVFLKNSTVESAIYFLLVTNQLEQQVMDANTILIYPNVAAKQKEYQEMVVKTFFLSNADAKSLANTLKTILKTRDVVVDEKLNLLIVRDTPEAIRLAERLVALQDVPEPEVMLEVEILEVKRTRLLDLGIDWPTSLTLSPLTTSGGTAVTLSDLQGLNKTRLGISSVSATVNANQTDTDANLLANPRIRVRNKEKAKVVIGDKVPVISASITSGTSTVSSESVSYIDVGLTLNAEPTIYLNNDVAIRMSLEVSNLVSSITTTSGTVAYQIGTRQVSTMLQLKDGENQVLAGLINNEDRSSGSKVPGLGELPVLGRLFGTTSDDKQKTEIVLSITPHLVRNIQRPQAAESEFSAGTESNFRRRPDLSARAAAQLPGTPAQAVTPGVTMQARPGMSALPAAPSQSPSQAYSQLQSQSQAQAQAQMGAQGAASGDAAAPNASQATPQTVETPQTGALPLSSGQPVPLQQNVPLSSGQPVPVTPTPSK
jgi:general secretion pathway protein D